MVVWGEEPNHTTARHNPFKSKTLVAFFRIIKNKETNIAQVGSLKAGVKTAPKIQQKTKLRPFKSKK
jgi:hypothetical protein